MFKKSSKRKCIFCGSDNITNEHIYPQWLFQIISIKEKTFKPVNTVSVTESTNYGDKLISADRFSDGREIKYEDFKTKQVCQKCNNEWMSVLETSVKNIFEKLSNSNFTYEMTSENAFDLSRWAIIKIILIGHTTEVKQHFDPFFLEMLRESIIPEGFIAEYRKMDTDFLNYCMGGNLVLDATRVTKEEIDLASDNFFVAGLHLGKIGLRISFFRSSIPVQRIQINEKLQLLFPYKGKLPYLRVDVDESLISSEKGDEISALCNCITLCDKL